MPPRPAPVVSPNRPALARMLEIHGVLNQGRRRRVNCATLGKDLRVSGKTVSRDIHYMRDTLRLPIAYDPQEKTFGYTVPDVRFPVGHDLSQDERIALAVARQALAVFRGVNFAEHLARAHDKLFGWSLSAHGLAVEGELGAYLSVRTPGAGVVDPRTFRAVMLALIDRRELRADYQAKGRPAATPRRLAPLHLACVDNRWVLVARDLEKEETRTYVLARLGSPRVTRDPITRPAGFDAAAHLGTSFGVWTGPGETVVRLRLSPEAAHHVLERHWHDTQRVVRRPGGVVEVGFRLSDLHDVTRWVLGFGGEVEVLEPVELRAAVAAEGRRMAERNA